MKNGGGLKLETGIRGRGNIFNSFIQTIFVKIIKM